MPGRTLTYDADSLLRNLFIVCVSLELLFVALDYHINYARGADTALVRALFSTAREGSLPSWFSILQTAMVAATLWLVYAVARSTGSRWQRRGWLALALFFSYLALDDGAQIHEAVGTAYHEAFTGVSGGLAAWTLEMFPSYRWQIVFVPLFGAMGLFMFGFLLRQLRGWKPKVAVFLALAMLAGAIGLDFLEGLPADHPLNPYTWAAQTWHLDYWATRTFGRTPYDTLLHFSKSIEETLEMFAMTVLWVVFLGHLTWLARDLRIRFVRLTAAAPAPRQAPASRDASVAVQPVLRAH